MAFFIITLCRTVIQWWRLSKRLDRSRGIRETWRNRCASRLHCQYITLPSLDIVCYLQIDTENSKKMKANLEKISADNNQMKKENAQLTKNLKAIS